MRAITKKAVEAFNDREEFNKSNTSVQLGVVTSKVRQVSLFLFGNLIATNYYQGETGLFIRNAGWKSNTTKERLNALPNVSIQQKAGEWYLNGKLWDGEMTKINL